MTYTNKLFIEYYLAMVLNNKYKNMCKELMDKYIKCFQKTF